MIEVNGLVKRFDGFTALDGATLSVPAGSVYGLVGPNGAGKSTLIRHLTGIFRQDAGTVRIGGENIWENAALKARIAAIPDDWYYFLQSSIRDMMRFYRGFYPDFSMERYEKLKEVFQLDEKRPIRRLSKGMQKQAAFWLALCCMPDYLILDEPVDGLDPVMRRQGGVPRRGDGGAGGPAGAPRQPDRPHPHPHHADERPGGGGPAGGIQSPAGGRGAPDTGGDLYLRTGRCGLCCQRHRTLTPHCSAGT